MGITVLTNKTCYILSEEIQNPKHYFSRYIMKYTSSITDSLAN